MLGIFFPGIAESQEEMKLVLDTIGSLRSKQEDLAVIILLSVAEQYLIKIGSLLQLIAVRKVK